MQTYIRTCIHTCMHAYTNVHVYMARERERERAGERVAHVQFQYGPTLIEHGGSSYSIYKGPKFVIWQPCWVYSTATSSLQNDSQHAPRADCGLNICLISQSPPMLSYTRHMGLGRASKEDTTSQCWGLCLLRVAAWSIWAFLNSKS